MNQISLIELFGVGAVGGLASGLIIALVSHFLARERAKKSAIKAEKIKFIPALEELIETTKNCDGLLAEVRARIRPKLYDAAMRFRIHLKGRRLAKFNTAWETLLNTTREEAPNQQPCDNPAEIARLQSALKSRFEAVLQIVCAS